MSLTPLSNIGGVPISSAPWYNTDGLICHLDGIENDGRLRHSSYTPTWKDLSGQGNDAIVNTGSAIFNADSFQGDGSMFFNFKSSFFENERESRKWTIETLFTSVLTGATTVNRYQGVICLGNRTAWITYSEEVTYQPYFTGVQHLFYWNVSNQGNSFRKPENKNGLRRTVLVANGNNFTSTIDGLKESKTATTVLNSDAIKNVGTFGNSSNFATFGNIYSIRVYNRPLSDAELAQNYEVDKARFNIQ